MVRLVYASICSRSTWWFCLVIFCLQSSSCDHDVSLLKALNWISDVFRVPLWSKARSFWFYLVCCLAVPSALLNCYASHVLIYQRLKAFSFFCSWRSNYNFVFNWRAVRAGILLQRWIVNASLSQINRKTLDVVRFWTSNADINREYQSPYFTSAFRSPSCNDGRDSFR